MDGAVTGRGDGVPVGDEGVVALQPDCALSLGVAVDLSDAGDECFWLVQVGCEVVVAAFGVEQEACGGLGDAPVQACPEEELPVGDVESRGDEALEDGLSLDVAEVERCHGGEVGDDVGDSLVDLGSGAGALGAGEVDGVSVREVAEGDATVPADLVGDVLGLVVLAGGEVQVDDRCAPELAEREVVRVAQGGDELEDVGGLGGGGLGAAGDASVLQVLSGLLELVLDVWQLDAGEPGVLGVQVVEEGPGQSWRAGVVDGGDLRADGAHGGLQGVGGHLEPADGRLEVVVLGMGRLPQGERQVSCLADRGDDALGEGRVRHDGLAQAARLPARESLPPDDRVAGLLAVPASGGEQACGLAVQQYGQRGECQAPGPVVALLALREPGADPGEVLRGCPGAVRGPDAVDGQVWDPVDAELQVQPSCLVQVEVVQDRVQDREHGGAGLRRDDGGGAAVVGAQRVGGHLPA